MPLSLARWVFVLTTLAAVSGEVRAECGDGVVDLDEVCDAGHFGVATPWAGPFGSPVEGVSAYGDGALMISGDEVLSVQPGGVASPLASFVGADLRGLAVDSDGVVFVVARATDRIERLGGSGILLGAYPLGGVLFSPEAVAISGNILFVVSARSAEGALRPIVRISRVDGTHLGAFGQATGERALAVFADGSVLAADGSVVRRFTPQGGEDGVFATLEGEVRDVLIAPDQAVFVRVGGSGDILVRFTAAGERLGMTTLGDSLEGPVTLADGDLIATVGEESLLRLVGPNSDHRPDTCRTSCVAPRCGDGVRDEAEACDDGNLESGDGCEGCVIEAGHVCLSSPITQDTCLFTCGNGALEVGEACDDGDLEGGDGCGATCVLEAGWRCEGAPSQCDAASCGDGLVAGIEECDDGAGGEDVAGDGCFECTVEAGWACDAVGCRQTCGDGELDSGEDCDDGGIEAGDGCSAGCRAELGWTCDGSCEAICGDTLVLGDEECEVDGPGCVDCVVAPGWVCSDEVCFDTCGDGVLDELEECDDGNTGRGDGCSVSCGIEAGWACVAGDDASECVAARCGDGLIAGLEQCDDGAVVDGDGCSAGCGLEAGWVCDDSGCRQTCGNGVLDEGEACDDGTTSGGDGCDPSCRLERGWSCPLIGGACTAARCGDGRVAGLEECDDGNVDPGDGCLLCKAEPGWVCDLAGCRQTCGNGTLEVGEVCDDGNLFAGDGCDGTCRRESGWVCQPLPVGCQTVCGDLVIAGAETCEDGNQVGGDGCEACVLTPGYVCPPPGIEEPCLPTCGNGNIDTHEACDFGDVEAGDGCSPGCSLEVGFECDEDFCVPVCGDARIAGNETCDDANEQAFDGCDGCVIERGFVCPDGRGVPSQAVCQETCGNNTLDALEDCDDGDLGEGDGCDEHCRVEAGWNCAGSPSLCDAARCGDDIMVGFEACDDGNEVGGDGCSASCSEELGFTCDVSGCVAVCGDSRTLGAEACDDGNMLSSDGCTACGVEAGWTCTAEPGGRAVCVPSEVCGDGRRGGTEECDDGDEEPEDGCYACEVEPGWACEGDECEPLDDDGDGLSNFEEARWLTRPDDPDSDRDGLEDGDEVARGTDPTRRDTDNDGLDDGLEVLLGLDPRQADSDFDGILDGVDNCPALKNPDQRDTDQDGVGTVCDPEEVPRGVLGGGDCSGGPWSFAGMSILVGYLVRRRSALRAQGSR